MIRFIRKKKYNKVIIITNGNNNGEDFINKARNIIKSNPICAVSAYNIRKHIKWAKEMKNVLLLNGIYYHEKFFKCALSDNKDSLNQLRKEIINNYNHIEGFNLKEFDNDLFSFPCFKSSGKFEELIFGPSTINTIPTKSNKNIFNKEENDSSTDEMLYFAKNRDNYIENGIKILKREPTYFIEDFLIKISRPICKIKNQDKKGTGFFIKIIHWSMRFDCLMTNKNVITREMVQYKRTIEVTYDFDEKN